MKTIADLKALYENTLQHELSALEAKRKTLAKAIIILCAITTPCVLLIFFIMQNIFLALIGAGVGVLCYKIFIKAMMSSFRDSYKENVVNAIISMIDESWSYNSDRYISENHYVNSNFFQKRYEHYKGDDYVCGKIDKTEFEFSELHTSYTVRTKNGSRRVTIFKGLFMRAEFNKEINGDTYVFPDFAEKTFGRLGQFFQKIDLGYGKLVKLENVEFEKHFVVYSDDQIEARYIITPKIMEAILELKNKYNQSPRLAFKGNHLYLALSFRKNLFEPKIFGSLVNFKDVEEVFALFQLIQVVISELDLNTRIWTKD